MNGLLHQLAVSLRLHFRNKMALIYSYLFPTIFLLAFWVLYRYETPPLARHMGELLTVTVLGGACFGLPTTMSASASGACGAAIGSRRSRPGIVASTVAARYLLLLIAGLLQLALAMAIGMPLPRHPLDLLIAFTFVSFAFIGLGPGHRHDGRQRARGAGARPMHLPADADHRRRRRAAREPARLGAARLGVLPRPLRRRGDQACVMGTGLGATPFSLLALLLIGAAGCVAGARMFRWDAQQRFAAIAGKGWVAVALAAWAAVGVAAEARHRTLVRTTVAATPAPAPATPQMSGATSKPADGKCVSACRPRRHSPNSDGWRADWGFLRCAGTVNASGSLTHVRACEAAALGLDGSDAAEEAQSRRPLVLGEWEPVRRRWRTCRRRVLRWRHTSAASAGALAEVAGDICFYECPVTRLGGVSYRHPRGKRDDDPALAGERREPLLRVPSEQPSAGEAAGRSDQQERGTLNPRRRALPP